MALLRTALGTVLALTLAPTAPAGAAQRLPVPVTGDDATPAAAANARGDAVVAWNARSGGTYVAFAARGGRFGRPRRIPGSRRLGYSYGPVVAVGGRGDAMIAWAAFDDSIPQGERDIRDEGCCFRVHAVVRRRSGRLTRVRTISPRGESADELIATAGGGRFGVLWSTSDDGPQGRLRVGGRGGRFGARAVMRGSGTPVALSLTLRQAVVLVLGQGPRGGERLATVRLSGSSLRRGRRRILRPRKSVFFSDEVFAVNARGDALALASRNGRGLALSGRAPGLLQIAPVGPEGAVALTPSGRGLAATGADRGRSGVVVRARSRDGRLGPARRRRVFAGFSPTVVGAAIAARGRTAIACTSGSIFTDGRLAVLVDGRRRTVSRNGTFVRSPVHVDARGRVRAIFVARGRVHSWRG